ncbi:uncharacterized protein LOC125578942 [Brassica napus]|uniref:uncharacterized protein LOC125578942 n=1 Tax=Brassica napus TaxID=3708 RepID=UPI00207881CB|nr:uncharacterized protein LOC125578942 [Brassica napus]
MGREIDWEDFETDFEWKYFSPKAKDWLEIQFWELTQGNRKVREYEAEFTKLRKYSPYGARNEGTLIRRFIRGLRADLASRLQVVKFHSLYELAEIAVNVQEGMEKEQAMMKHSEPSRRTEGLGIRRMNNKGQFNRGRSRGRRNDRRFGNGPNVCYTCGGTSHFSSSCPYSQGRKAPDYITCFSSAPPTILAIEPAPKRQAVGKQVNALELGKPEPQQPHQGPITGTLCVGGVYVHALFDSGATHSFVIPEVVSSFKGTFTRVKVGVLIRTPRNRNLHADSCVLGIPIHVGSMVYPADLLVVPLAQHEVILGMDWLPRYYAQLDCGRGRITLEKRGQPSTTYYGICPSSGVSLVSALRVKKDLIKGEVYLLTLTILVEDLKEGTQLE